MKRSGLLVVFLLSTVSLFAADAPWSFRGTVTRMQMSDCTEHHCFKAAMSGAPAQSVGTCPEYTVMSDKVVYIVVARRAEEFMPLAEDINFLIRKNELLVFSGDEKTQSHFTIKQMTLRAEWDREESLKDLAIRKMERSVNYEVRNPPRAAIISTDAR